MAIWPPPFPYHGNGCIMCYFPSLIFLLCLRAVQLLSVAMVTICILLFVPPLRLCACATVKEKKFFLEPPSPANIIQIFLAS